jgi:hypothetical protein
MDGGATEIIEGDGGRNYVHNDDRDCIDRKDVDGKISAVGSDGNNSVAHSMDIYVENLDYDCNNSFSLSEQ